MDVRGLDMGLVGDKIERAVKEAVTKHLLVDVKSKKLVVVLPSLIPHILLSTVLATLFKIFQNPGVTLLSAPVLSTVVAGLRSGLVVDIGWRETIVTGIYEYREVQEKRTTRAMRMVTLEMAKLLERQDTEPRKDGRKPADAAEEDRLVAIDLEQTEEVTRRMAWCRSRSGPNSASQTSQDLPGQLVAIAEDGNEDQAISSNSNENTPISVPSPSSPRLSIQLPFSAFASPVETALIGNSLRRYELDDHDQPLHNLIYRSLLSLPADVRAVCMSRIIFTGGGSNIPGLKARLLDEVTALIKARGWDPVEGKVADQRRKLKGISGNRQARQATKSKDVKTNNTNDEMDQQKPKTNVASPASLAPQLSDPIEEKIRREQDKGMTPTVSGVIRGVESLGAWAGASLLASLRIKGVVEIERDSFQQHGLAGARKIAEASAAPQKGMPRPSVGGQSGWTLGPWA